MKYLTSIGMLLAFVFNINVSSAAAQTEDCSKCTPDQKAHCALTSAAQCPVTDRTKCDETMAAHCPIKNCPDCQGKQALKSPASNHGSQTVIAKKARIVNALDKQVKQSKGQKSSKSVSAPTV